MGPTHLIILHIESPLPGVKRPETDRSPELSADVMNEWSYTSVPTNSLGRYSSICIASLYELDVPGIEFRWGLR
jgi:hypothetical protein